MPEQANILRLPRRTGLDPLRAIPTRDLVAEVEAAQWLVAELIGTPGDSLAIARIQLQEITKELERRQRIAAVRPGAAPKWPQKGDRDARVAVVRDRWPIEVYCEHLLGCRLERHGRDSLFATCPLPGHDDSSASFHVTPSKGLAYCHGCHRGGDIIALTKHAFGLTRFFDALERLEDEAGIAA